MSSTPDEVRRARAVSEQKKQLATEQRERDLKWLMSDPAGRRLMWGWLGDFGLYRTPFAGGDIAKTNFNLGTHNCALQLVAQVVVTCPDEYDLMQREAREDRALTSRKQG